MTRHPRAADAEPDRLAHLLGDLADEDGGGPHDGADGRHRVPLLSVPRSLRSLDLAVGLRAVRGLLVVALVVVLVLTGRWAWALRSAGTERAQEVVAESGEDAPADPSPSRSEESGPEVDEEEGTVGSAHEGGGDAAGVPPSPPPHLLVHVAGQVGTPGVVQVPPGSRVIDAVAAAGGFTAEADQSVLNLARPVVDGEQVWVGRPGEPAPPSAVSPPAGTPSGAGGSGGGGPGADGGQGPPLDLNAATQADLEELPGIGPVTAAHILAWRDAHGSFTRVDELLEVSGIGERTLAQLEPLVSVGG